MKGSNRFNATVEASKQPCGSVLAAKRFSTMDSTQQPPPLAGYDNQRQARCDDNISVSNNFNMNKAIQQQRPVDEFDLELRQHTAATHPYHSNFASASNLHMSTASLAEHSASSLGTQQHQYHYIQYPPYYYHIGLHAQRQQQQQQQGSLLGIPEVACHCHCSCGAQQQQQQQQQQLLNQRYYQQRNFSASSTAIGQTPRIEGGDSSKIVVQVHCQSNSETDCEREREPAPTKAQSEQSLLNHSYQTLQLQSATEEKPLNVLCNSKLNISCDCDLECTCGGAERLRSAAVESAAMHTTSSKAAASSDVDLNADILDTPSPLKNQKQCQIEAMLGADEITVSESDNNSTMIKKKKKTSGSGSSCTHTNNEMNSWCHLQDQNSPLAADKNCDCHYNSSHIEIYSDGDSKGGHDSIDDQRPPLPPRPPPPPRLRNATITGNGVHRHGAGIKKYVVWCLICGGFSCLLGILFLGVYFLLHSYTITVGNFETVPTFVPATLLILTGICIISLARRRNRYSYLIKLSGVCGLISALTCALVTVTTTVLHMSRLQALRECEYAQKTRTCTCYSDMIESQVDRVDKGVRLVFDSLSDCGVVHGSLYSCLRAIFGLSVAGVLVAVFSCMLVYQLLSHERKKMYWEQLELRCRSLYTSQQGPPPNMAAMAGGRGPICRCCEQCHLHRQVPLQATAYPWDDSGEPRFWTGQPPGNFYSPNPGGDDLHMANAGTACRGHGGASGARSRMTGWSWPRMPWQRNSPVPNARQFRQTPSSPDSQYGFTNNAPAAVDNMMTADSETAPTVGHGSAAPPFNVVGGALPYGVWGPPPPYSDPNSPARRGYYQYIQPNPCGNINAANNNINHSAGNMPNESNISVAAEQRMPCLNHRSVFLEQQPHQLNGNGGNCCPTASMRRNLAKRRTTGGNGGGGSGGEDAMKSKTGGGDYENTPSESDGCNMRDRFSNTLPTRKVKKRNETNVQANIIGSTNPQPAPRLSMQQVNANTDASCTNEHDADATLNDDDCMDQCTEGMCDEDKNLGGSASSRIAARATLRRKRGNENSGFPANCEVGVANKTMTEGESDAVVIAADMHSAGDPAESEVYFADVSSCCNMSLKNDNYYDEAHQIQHHVPAHHHHQHQNSNCSQNSSSNNEDYLAQRFGPRENSIRSRLPFPQARTNDYEENLNTSHQKEIGGSITPVNQMQKEISRQSMCSVESEAQTDCTDLSPATPCSNKFAQTNFEGKITTTTTNDGNDVSVPQRVTGAPLPNFIAKFPYSSESQSLEAHRRSTKDIHDLILSSEAHYEVINDNPQPTPPPCQFTAQQPTTTRINKPQPQRPTNLSTSKSKAKQGVKTRDRIEANVLQSERDWPIPSGVGNVNKGVVVGVGGGGLCNNNERKCL
ncbi:PREDICTED: uncharacterized protein LOC108369778 isoform X2 [Rhagoletis zephyria]|uniref:uncharacterized protein LOC108369778 isoform X2 n=1 Tax=Rhagoletis zephyria TaxID=28612 RepID=UPI000811787C|nr:PREDICTED: uncharacterized protein LOC108369778 isoform X2 [Rhagoletis zephyria]